MSDNERLTFPTQKEAMDLIDQSRRPYAIVRDTLMATDVMSRRRMIAQSIRVVNFAQLNGMLEPPLPEPLAEAISRADSCIDANLTPQHSKGFSYDVGEILLSAVFENGYKTTD